MSVENVFVLHHGSASYLRHCLSFSKNSGNRTILVGSDVRFEEKCDEYWDDGIPLPDYDKFCQYYKHMSTNSEEFELLCFRRYFLMLAVARSKNIDHFWMIDSDILLMESLEPMTRFLLEGGYKASLTFQETQREFSWSASAHISFWTVEALANFVEFLCVLYTTDKIHILNEKYRYHVSHNLAGGICDMTALYLWEKERGDTFNNATAHLHGMALYDHNINCDFNYSDDQFQMVPFLGVKRVKYDGAHCVAVRQNGSTCRIASLHFQGSAKKYMDRFVESKSLSLLPYLSYLPLKLREKLASLVRRAIPKTVS